MSEPNVLIAAFNSLSLDTYKNHIVAILLNIILPVSAPCFFIANFEEYILSSQENNVFIAVVLIL